MLARSFLPCDARWILSRRHAIRVLIVQPLRAANPDIDDGLITLEITCDRHTEAEKVSSMLIVDSLLSSPPSLIRPIDYVRWGSSLTFFPCQETSEVPALNRLARRHSSLFEASP